MPERRLPPRCCKGVNKRGKPCRVAPLKDGEYCRAHDPELPEEARFGSSVQATKAATGVERRFPRLREVVEREYEVNADKIVSRQIEALDATKVVVNEVTGEVTFHPDYGTRLKSTDLILSRALGRPGSEQTINVDARSIHFDFDLSDEQLATVHGLLRDRPAIAASVER